MILSSRGGDAGHRGTRVRFLLARFGTASVTLRLLPKGGPKIVGPRRRRIYEDDGDDGPAVDNTVEVVEVSLRISRKSYHRRRTSPLFPRRRRERGRDWTRTGPTTPTASSTPHHLSRVACGITCGVACGITRGVTASFT